MIRNIFHLILVVPLLSGLVSCSSSIDDSTGSESDLNDDDTTTVDNTVNTAKLIGTPFEGLETGDDLPWELFLEDKYATHTVSTVPVPIFLAFFTASEEIEIQEGISIANSAIGFTAFEVTDVYADDVRFIIKVNEIADPSLNNGEPRSAVGRTFTIRYCFNSKIFSDCIEADWAIEIKNGNADRWTIAHELGHAFGMNAHALIDYEYDSLLTLEEGSLMDQYSGGTNPALTDYTTMMQRQGEILLDHLNDASGTRFLVQ